ncbi:MAG: Cys-tRNA(Pro) deacylase [bacterium]|nr:Cys-tRNA(Pro) deacylase [bacterium]MDE0601409.1 Cys-tRNA(Pro) deacylase [bacterium]
MSAKRAGGTRATVALERAAVPFRLWSYRVDYQAVADYGKAVAEALGVEPARLFKTLVAFADDRPLVGLVPADARLSVKSLARVMGVRRVRLASPQEARRLTGYVPGGISPFGQRRRMPVLVDESALDHRSIWVSAGKRGLQIEIDPAELVRFLEARTASISTG